MSALSEESDSTSCGEIALGHKLVAVAAMIDIGGLTARGAVVGAVPTGLRFSTIINQHTLTIVYPYLIVYNTSIYRCKAVVVIHPGSKDIGEVDGGSLHANGFGSSICAHLVINDQHENNRVGLATTLVSELGTRFIHPITINKPALRSIARTEIGGSDKEIVLGEIVGFYVPNNMKWNNGIEADTVELGTPTRSTIGSLDIIGGGLSGIDDDRTIIGLRTHRSIGGQRGPMIAPPIMIGSIEGIMLGRIAIELVSNRKINRVNDREIERQEAVTTHQSV